MESAKVYNWLTSGDRLQQYERGKVQCRQSGERYPPICKKKVTTCYTQCYTILNCVICYYKLFPSLVSGVSATLTCPGLALNHSAWII